MAEKGGMSKKRILIEKVNDSNPLINEYHILIDGRIIGIIYLNSSTPITHGKARMKINTRYVMKYVEKFVK